MKKIDDNIKQNKIFSTIIKLIIFLTILIILFNYADQITKRKYSYVKTEDFFGQKENFDVLFFGSSHMLNSVFPMKLWNDYGIVSYNLANQGERLAVSYWNMKLAMQYKKPKLIVIDTFQVLSDELMDKEKNFTHLSLDAYPSTYLKYQAIKDLLYDDNNLLDKMAEYLFPFSKYHNRWKELSKDDFNYKNLKSEKGSESVINVSEIKTNMNYDSVEIYNGREYKNMQYLRKFILYCKENDIEVLLTYVPVVSNGETFISTSKYIEKIAKENDVNYINFLNKDIINYKTDFYDEGAHLNPSGARKVTNYIGKYIIENYDIQDQRENEVYEFWNEDYNEYIDFKIKKLAENEKNLNNYLMLLYEENNIKYEIKLSSKREIEEGSTLQSLLQNINNNYEIDDEVFKDNKDKTIKITTYDCRDGHLIKTVWF